MRLAALRHFAKSGWQVNDLGDSVNTVDVDDAAWLVAGTGSAVASCSDDGALHEVITNVGLFSVFHLEPLGRSLIGARETPHFDTPIETSPSRRTA